MDAPPPAPKDGRSFGWRLAMLAAGAVCGGAAVLLFVWPRLLAWAVAALLAGLCLLLVASALLARGRR